LVLVDGVFTPAIPPDPRDAPRAAQAKIIAAQPKVRNTDAQCSLEQPA
jgi:hypothetical protein